MFTVGTVLIIYYREQGQEWKSRYETEINQERRAVGVDKISSWEATRNGQILGKFKQKPMGGIGSVDVRCEKKRSQEHFFFK